MPKKMTQDEWYQYGVDNGYVEVFCATHDIYESAEEIEMFEAGEDPCVAVIRLALLDE